MRRNKKSGINKERIIMLASSAFVLAALTMTGVYMKGQNVESRDDGYTLDFTALPNNADDKLQEITENNDEHLLKEDENIPGLTANNTAGNEIAGTPVTEDDLDYMPQEVGSGNVEIPGLTDQETLLEAAQRLDADVVQGGWQYLYTDGSYGPVQCYPAAVYIGNAAPERFELPGMPWGKIYRRELFAQVRFPAYYTCFEDTIIHFLVFRQAKAVVSVPEVVYLWRKNPKGLTATSQHRPAAVQSYWIMEQLAVQDAALGLPHDALYRCTLTLQLSAFCYATISGLPQETQQAVFRLCCALYAKALPQESALPRRARWGTRALRQQDFGLWCRYGRRFQLL